MKPAVALLLLAFASLAACSSDRGAYDENSGSSVPPQTNYTAPAPTESTMPPSARPYNPETDTVSPPGSHQ